jgi:hypothetical protein
LGAAIIALGVRGDSQMRNGRLLFIALSALLTLIG